MKKLLVTLIILFMLVGCSSHNHIQNFVNTTVTYEIITKHNLQKVTTENLSNYNDYILVKVTTDTYICSCPKIIQSSTYQVLRNADPLEIKMYKSENFKNILGITILTFLSVMCILFLIVLVVFSIKNL